MSKARDCPVCGGPIMLEYIRPNMYFYFNEDGKLKRDTNHDLWEGTIPYLKFVCTNDSEHDMEEKTILDDPDDNSLATWMNGVEKEFFKNILPDEI